MTGCWSVGEAGGDMAWVDGVRHEGTASLRVSAGGEEVAFISSPGIEVERLDDKMLGFYAYTDDEEPVSLIVFAGKGDDVSADPMAYLTLTKADGWKEFTVYFDALTDEDAQKYKNISIVYNGNGSYYLDDFSLTAIPSCPKPAGISVSDVTANSAVIGWTSVDGDAVCNIRLTSQNGEEKTFAGVRSPYKVDGLNAQTYYTVELVAVCGADDESDAAKASFTTGCGTAVFPFAENFDNMLEGELSECWDDETKTGTADTNNKWMIGREGENGTNSLMFNSTQNWAGNTCMVKTPVIDLIDVETAYLSFRMAAPGGAALDVLVSDDGGETFSILQGGIVSREWNTFVYELSDNLLGHEISVGFRGVSNRLSANLYVDDIEVAAQADCPQASVAVTTVYADSVELTVNAVTGESWHIAVVEKGEKVDDGYDGYVPFEEKNGIVRGLKPTTSYDVYVRTVCGEEEYSSWYGPVYFETGCGVQPVGYSEDFEAYMATDELKCIFAIGNTGIGNFGPNTDYEITADEAVAVDGKSLSMRNITTNGGVWVVLPAIDGDIEELMLSYEVNTNLEEKEVEIWLLSEDDIDWGPENGKLVTRNIHGKGVSAGEAYFDAAGLVGRDYRIAVWTDKLVTMVGNNETFALDNIKVERIPQFFTPHDIRLEDVSHNSARIVWRKSGEAVASQIMVLGKEDGLIDVSGADASYLFENLGEDTEYTVMIRDIRGSAQGDTTEWSALFSFRTSKAPATVPYNCDFEDDEENSNWTFAVNGSYISATWVISDAVADGIYEGERSLYVEELGLHRYSQGVSPFSLEARRSLQMEKGSYNVRFVYHIDSYVYGNDEDWLQVWLVPAGMKPGDAGSIDVSCELVGASEWTDFSGYVKVPDAGNYDLVFVQNSVVTQWGAPFSKPGAVDNIVIEEAGCVPPLNVRADSVRSNSAIVLLDNMNTKGNEAEYVLLAGGEEFDEEGAEIRSEESDTIRLTGLVADGRYSVRLRMKCGNNYTNWSEVSFVTPCEPETVDVDNEVYDGFEEYDGENLGCWQYPDKATVRWSNDAADVIPYDGDRSIVIRGNSEAMIYRPFALTAGLNYQVLLYAKQNLTQNTGTSVDVLLGGEFDSADDFWSVAYANPVTGNEWTLFTYRFTVDKDGVYNIGIKGVTTGATRYLAVDSVVIRAVACDMPVNLQTMFSPGFEQVFWSGGTAPYDVTITANGAKVVHKTVDAPFFMLSDMLATPLPSAVRYTVSVRSVCAEVRISDPAEITFVSPCAGAVAAPYFEDFDLDGSLPECWQAEKINGIEFPWERYVENDGNGVVKFDSRDNPTGATDRLFSPAVVVAEEGWSLSVDYINPAGGELSVYLSTDGGATYDKTLLDRTVGVPVWQTLNVPLDDYVGKEVTMVAKGVSNYSLADGAYIYLDNFRISKVAETKELRDTSCYESAYDGYGFHLPSGALGYGDNELTRIAYGNDGAPDTLYSVSVWVPLTDYYFTDMFVEREAPYEGYGFEGIGTADYEYTRTVKSESCGCDSTIHLTLIPMVLNVELYDTICEADAPYEFCTGTDRMELTESGDYTCVAENSFGRDSTTVLHLTVLPSVVERTDTVCEGDFVMFDGEERTESGVYEADSTYEFGCDYKSILHLTVVPSVIEKDTVICEGRYVEIDGERYSEAGSYNIPLASVGGCSRMMVLELTVTPRDTVGYEIVVCEGRPVDFSGFAGRMVYQDTVMYRTDKTAVGGCDSVTRLDVTLIPTKHAYDTVRTTDKYYIYNGQTLTSTGDYSETLEANDEYACDSVNHLHIEFVTEDGLDDVMVKELVIAPNPTGIGVTTYADGNWTGEATIEITDNAGRTVYRGKVTGRPVQIEGLAVSGVYIVRVIEEDGTVHTGRLMVR